MAFGKALSGRVAAALCLLAVSTAQVEAAGADQALALRDNVVAIQVRPLSGPVREGFGFITGQQDGLYYVATANHVLRGPTPDDAAESVSVRLRQFPGRIFEAEILGTHDSFLDIGVIVLNLPDNIEWQRRAVAPDNEELSFGSPVWFIGRDQDWYVPATPGGVNTVDPLRHEIVTDGLDVRVGTSGGPLVSESGIVGMMIVDSASSRSRAVSAIELAFGQWGLPWQLRPASGRATERPTPPDRPEPETPGRPYRVNFEGDREAPRMLRGGEFRGQGLLDIKTVVTGSYCRDAEPAVLAAGSYRAPRPFLSTASPGNFRRCNGMPLSLKLRKPVRRVSISFYGADVPYVLRAYNARGDLLRRTTANATPYNYTRDNIISLSVSSDEISRVEFGYQSALTMIRWILLEP